LSTSTSGRFAIPTPCASPGCWPPVTYPSFTAAALFNARDEPRHRSPPRASSCPAENRRHYHGHDGQPPPTPSLSLPAAPLPPSAYKSSRAPPCFHTSPPLAFLLSLAHAVVIPERRRRHRSSSPPLFLDNKPPPELRVVVGIVANPSSLSLAPSHRRDCSPEQPSRMSTWRAPLQPPHRRPEPSIEFTVISSRSQAKPHEKLRLRTPNSVNSADSTAASLAVGYTTPPPAPSPRSQPSAAIGSGSNGPDPVQLGSTKSIPVSPSVFAKEALQFSKIKPQSTLVQKYLQNSPFFSALAPVLSSFCIRRPNPAVFLV
jgi:hypothetical protein